MSDDGPDYDAVPLDAVDRIVAHYEPQAIDNARPYVIAGGVMLNAHDFLAIVAAYRRLRAAAGEGQ